VFLPVDLQDPPELIPEMVRYWESGIEIIAGVRENLEETWALRISRRLFYRLVSALWEFEIPENVGEFQLIDRRVWEVVVSHHDQYPYIRGIIASAGFRRLVKHYTWRARKRGISKNNALRLIDQAMNGFSPACRCDSAALSDSASRSWPSCTRFSLLSWGCSSMALRRARVRDDHRRAVFLLWGAPDVHWPVRGNILRRSTRR
jgi:hypothetical protein